MIAAESAPGVAKPTGGCGIGAADEDDDVDDCQFQFCMIAFGTFT